MYMLEKFLKYKLLFVLICSPVVTVVLFNRILNYLGFHFQRNSEMYHISKTVFIMLILFLAYKFRKQIFKLF